MYNTILHTPEQVRVFLQTFWSGGERQFDRLRKRRTMLEFQSILQLMSDVQLYIKRKTRKKRALFRIRATKTLLVSADATTR